MTHEGLGQELLDQVCNVLLTGLSLPPIICTTFHRQKPMHMLHKGWPVSNALPALLAADYNG